MRLILHRLVEKDLRLVLRYYEEEGGLTLADRFFTEADALIAEIAGHPTRFHPISQGLRRANLKMFPYHFLFRETPAGVRVLVLRHHKRHPNFGLERR